MLAQTNAPGKYVKCPAQIRKRCLNVPRGFYTRAELQRTETEQVSLIGSVCAATSVSIMNRMAVYYMIAVESTRTLALQGMHYKLAGPTKLCAPHSVHDQPVQPQQAYRLRDGHPVSRMNRMLGASIAQTMGIRLTTAGHAKWQKQLSSVRAKYRVHAARHAAYARIKELVGH